MHNLLSIHTITYRYPGGTSALQGVQGDFTEGSSTGIIGPNGAGKTTLFMVLCGLIEADQGHVTIRGEKVLPHTFNPAIGYVFQNPDDQLFNPRVYDDVAFGPRNLGWDQAQVHEKTESMLVKTGIHELAQRPPHNLSGGEKRMVAIASVLVMEPDVVIFDEPTANLDHRHRRRVIEMIHTLKGTFLIASHDMDFILETCQEVCIVDEGQFVTRGPAREIMSDRALMEAHGLEVPCALRRNA